MNYYINCIIQEPWQLKKLKKLKPLSLKEIKKFKEPWRLCLLVYYNYIDYIKENYTLKKLKRKISKINDNIYSFTAAVGNIIIIKYLEFIGFDITKKNQYGKIVLHYVNDINIFTYLHSRGHDINVIDSWGETPFLSASKKGNVKILKYLYNNGVNIYQTDILGINAILLAKNIKTLKYLETIGLSLNSKDNYGINVYLHAANIGNIKMLKYLESRGFNINYKDDLGYTAIFFAIINGNMKVVKYLVNSGINLYSLNIRFNNIFILATMMFKIKKFNRIYKFLISYDLHLYYKRNVNLNNIDKQLHIVKFINYKLNMTLINNIHIILFI